MEDFTNNLNFWLPTPYHIEGSAMLGLNGVGWS